MSFLSSLFGGGLSSRKQFAIATAQQNAQTAADEEAAAQQKLLTDQLAKSSGDQAAATQSVAEAIQAQVDAASKAPLIAADSEQSRLAQDELLRKQQSAKGFLSTILGSAKRGDQSVPVATKVLLGS